MPSISAINGINSGLSNILSALGLNGWILKDGKYNGCTFAAFVDIPILENNPIFQEGANLVASINELSGLNLGGDPNGLGKLINTYLGSLQFSENMIRQIAVKQLPFTNRCNTEDMGTGGTEYRMSLLFLGSEYQKAVRNIKNAILNPPLSSADNLVLVHPTEGKIPGITRVTEFRTDTTLANWNATTVHITFRCEQTAGIQQIKNLTADILAAIAALLALIAAIKAEINIIQEVLTNGNLPNYQPSNATNTAISNTKVKVDKLSNNLLANTNYIYKASSPPGVSNSTLDVTPIDYSALPPALNQVTKYSAIQGLILLQDYISKCDAIFVDLLDPVFQGQSNNLVNLINDSKTALSNLSTLVVNSPTTLSYLVPYNMSIRTALVLNGRNINEAPAVLAKNPFILSANYLPEGTVIAL